MRAILTSSPITAVQSSNGKVHSRLRQAHLNIIMASLLKVMVVVPPGLDRCCQCQHVFGSATSEQGCMATLALLRLVQHYWFPFYGPICFPGAFPGQAFCIGVQPFAMSFPIRPLAAVTAPIMPGKCPFAVFVTCCILASIKAPVRPAHHGKAVELPVTELTNIPPPIIPGKGSTTMFGIFLEVALVCAALHLEEASAMLLCAQVCALVKEFLG
mmetsp:Transcript_78056/g.154687  ORF Transcript_78056/g.154687 Transcript_78056/m.154687 type:complete len:214 (+) Transcript_78056:47-688(+)